MQLTDFSVVFAIDIQCNYDYDGYLFVKELCVQHFKNKIFLHTTYQPPLYLSNQNYNAVFARRNRWAVYNHHQISMDEGARPYEYLFVDLERILSHCLDNQTLIYVAGIEKMRLLTNLLCGYENSKALPDLILPKNILIFDIANNVTNKKNISIADSRNLTLYSGKQERKKYLIMTFLSGKNPCIFHTSYNCARVNCQYLLDKYYTALRRIRKNERVFTNSFSSQESSSTDFESEEA